MTRDDIRARGQMKPDIYRLLEMCVENGAAHGVRRAYKHNEAPTEEQIAEKVTQHVMNEICEWFEFEPREP